MVKFLDQAGLSALWNKIKQTFYTKPDDGIPFEDLSIEVQDELTDNVDLSGLVSHEYASITGALEPTVSSSKKNVTMFAGTLVNYKISDFPNLDPRNCEGISFLFDRRYPDNYWNGNNVMVSSNLLEIYKDSNNQFYIKHNGWQLIVFLKVGGTTIINQIVNSSGTSPLTKEHVVVCIDLKNAIVNSYFDGRFVDSATVAQEDLRPYFQNFTNVRLIRPEIWGNKGAALFNYCLNANEVSALFNMGNYVDYLIPYAYISDSFTSTTLSLSSINSSHASTTTYSNKTDTSVDVSVTGSQSNGYQRLTLPSYIETKNCELKLHINVTSGQFNFVGFGTNGRWSVTRTDQNGNIVSNPLTAGNEYDIVARSVAPSGTSGPYLFNYTFSDACSFTISNCKLIKIGAPVICAPQNYNELGFTQGNGDILPTSCTTFEEPYKDKVVEKSSRRPQYTGQIAVDSTNNKVYFGLRSSWLILN